MNSNSTTTPTDPPTTSSSSTTLPPTSEPPTSSSSSSSIPTTSSSTPTTSSSPPTTSQPPTSAPPTSTIRTTIITNPGGSTITTVVTSIRPPATSSGTKASDAASSTETTSLQSGSAGSGKGLHGGGTIAVAVVVPIVGVALLVLGGLFLWRKRKARKDAEELRRKEVEEYGYNPNNDPTLPPAGTTGSDGPFEMREEGASGYRGWGTTAVASSTGRKASTTLSGGQSTGGIGMAYSEGTSATGAISEGRSDQPLVDGSPTIGEGEPLGAMGPAASGNRTDINRGPSNASSSYSAANRSDGSGELAPQGGGYPNNQYDTGNPYGNGDQYGGGQGRTEMPAQPIIRDVQARRNTRIENPSHFPQQSAGISQNF